MVFVEMSLSLIGKACDMQISWRSLLKVDF
jgi:hypothetical protein